MNHHRHQPPRAGRFAPHCEPLEDRTVLNAGALDPSFGAGGVVATDFAGRVDQGRAVLVQPDGKVVIGGGSFLAGPQAGKVTGDWALARYNADGTPDAGFHGNGQLLIHAWGDQGEITTLRRLADGKLLAVGRVYTLGGGGDLGESRVALARVNPDGTLDATFGTGGVVVSDFAGTQDEVADAVVLANGKILVAANLEEQGQTLVRYNADGSLDATFGTAGQAPLNLAVTAVNRLAVQADGKVLVAGTSIPTPGGGGGANFFLARLKADGGLDATFGTGGTVTTDVAGGTDVVQDLAVAQDGRILAVGAAQAGADPDAPERLAGVRYLANGQLDPSFGTGGKVTVDPGAGQALTGAASVALQGDGKILLISTTGAAAGADQVQLRRFLPNGTPDTAFGTQGVATLAADGQAAVARQANGEVVVAAGAVDFLAARFETGDTSLPNHAPKAGKDAATTPENTPVTIDVLANDSDPDGDALAVTILSATHGTAAVNATGQVVFTPAADYHGAAQVRYQIGDGRGGTAQGLIDVTVTSVNTVPTANPDSYQVQRNGTLAVAGKGVLANDADNDGPQPLQAQLVSGPAHGTLNLGADGHFTYKPAAGYLGPDSFTYKAFDGQDASAAATVSITVSRANRPPVAVPDVATTNEDTPITVDVLKNDKDPDGDPLTVSIVSAAHGTAQVDGQGRIVYTPDANYNGPAQVKYQISDGQGGTASSVLTVIVKPVNDAPTALNDVYRVTTGKALAVTPGAGVLANDGDPDGGKPVKAALVDGPAHGTLTLGAAGGFTYVPDAGYAGQDSFTYKAGDGQLESTAALVTLNVYPPAGITGIQVNDGAEQRSMLTSLEIAFSEIVNVQPGAFQLTRKDGTPVAVQVTSTVLGGKTTVRLTPQGAGVIGGSPADGNYLLTIRGDRLQYGIGQAVDADDDGKMGGTKTVITYRFFGDVNGDRTVNATDQAAFSAALGTVQGQPGFLAAFDYNGDGKIDVKDQAEFGKRFGKTLS